MCRAEMSRAHSALVGAAIKLGECMGLHRDPSNYRASRVDTHVRRLLWYQLCFLDLRTCEAQGPRPSIRREDFDTKLPLNVDDDDLDSLEPNPADSIKWTDNTFTRIRFECNEMHRVIWIDRVRLERKEISLTNLMAKTESFRKAMEAKYLPMIDPSIPLQQLAKYLLSVLINRMTTMILHRYHNSVSVRMPDRLRQVLLTHGTQQMEDSVIMDTDPAFKLWSWYNGAYTQYHVAFLLLMETFAFPKRREADRIWRCLDYIYEVEPSLPRDHKARTILTDMRDKAAAYRNVRKMRAPVNMWQKVVDKETQARKDDLPGNADDDLMNFARIEAQSEKVRTASASASPTAQAQTSAMMEHLGASPREDFRGSDASSPGMSAAASDTNWNFDTQATFFSRPDPRPDWEKEMKIDQGLPKKQLHSSVPPLMSEYPGLPQFSAGWLNSSGTPAVPNFMASEGVDSTMGGMPNYPAQESMDVDWVRCSLVFYLCFHSIFLVIGFRPYANIKFSQNGTSFSRPRLIREI